MLLLYNKNYLCIVQYHNKFPVIIKTGSLLTDSLILAGKITFSEYRLTKKMSDVGGNFISEKFKEFSINWNIEQAVSSS